jgi:hypothetical protein
MLNNFIVSLNFFPDIIIIIINIGASLNFFTDHFNIYHNQTFDFNYYLFGMKYYYSFDLNYNLVIVEFSNNPLTFNYFSNIIVNLYFLVKNICWYKNSYLESCNF